MIFVTVGTHEQQFDRLIKKIDQLKENNSITEKIIMQIGYSNYMPKFCEYKKFFPYLEMKELMKQARIVITHGGPSSFIQALQCNKIPIVVPRQESYKEHINNHQVNFVKQLYNQGLSIIPVFDTGELYKEIINYKEFIKKDHEMLFEHNRIFVKQFIIIADKLFSDN